MSTSTQTRNEPAAVPSSRSFKPRDAMSYKARIAKEAKQSFYTRFGIAILIALRLNKIANIIDTTDNNIPVMNMRL